MPPKKKDLSNSWDLPSKFSFNALEEPLRVLSMRNDLDDYGSERILVEGRGNELRIKTLRSDGLDSIKLVLKGYSGMEMVNGYFRGTEDAPLVLDMGFYNRGIYILKGYRGHDLRILQKNMILKIV